ncbi:MAG TPA: FHA domain-containing protein, partial [Acidimicrobiales bacterium]
MNSDLTRPTLAGPAPLPRLQVVAPAVDPDHPECWERDVLLTLHHGGATVADLGMALGLAGPGGGLPRLLIDGRAVAPGLPLRATGVCRGSVITAHGHADSPAATDGETGGETSAAVEEVALRTIAGPDAGRELTIGVGRHVVGRSSAVDVHLDDPVLARRHAVVELDALGQVTITDLASPRPSRLDGAVLDGSTPIALGQRLTMGSTIIEVAAPPPPAPGPRVPPPPPTGPASGAVGWTRPLLRPPRGPTPAPVPPVIAPTLGAAAGSPVPLGMAAVVTTVLASCVVALVMHQPAFVILGA